MLEQFPEVAEVAVFGVACEDAEKEVPAAIVARAPDIDLADLLAFARARLPAYAVPTLLRLLPDLLRTPTAKVRKAQLRDADRATYTAAAELRRPGVNRRRRPVHLHYCPHAPA